jgi:hypothetical protein
MATLYERFMAAKAAAGDDRKPTLTHRGLFVESLRKSLRDAEEAIEQWSKTDQGYDEESRVEMLAEATTQKEVYLAKLQEADPKANRFDISTMAPRAFMRTAAGKMVSVFFTGAKFAKLFFLEKSDISTEVWEAWMYLKPVPADAELWYISDGSPAEMVRV